MYVKDLMATAIGEASTDRQNVGTQGGDEIHTDKELPNIMPY